MKKTENPEPEKVAVIGGVGLLGTMIARGELCGAYGACSSEHKAILSVGAIVFGLVILLSLILLVARKK